ncbi:MAG: prolyl oligopeptidase family protein [Steroidobacteraceae bacterium]|nr:prolyl oligopeptidase family protein [Steroidobacteraceae bacterium]
MQPAIRLIAALLALAPFAVQAADVAALPLSAEAMWKIQRVGDPALSSDGRQAVYPVTVYDDEQDKGEADLYLVAASGGASRRLTSMPGKESEPAWSPDGRWIAFVAKRSEDKESQLYVIATDGGEATRVGEVPTGISSPKWFPDSKRIAFISRVWPELADWKKAGERLEERAGAKMKAQAWSRPPIAYWDHWIDDRQAHVFSIPLAGGTPTAITLGTGFELTRQELDGHAYDIAPDGSEIAFVADIDPTGVDQNFDVFIVPAGGGIARNLTSDNSGDDENPAYSPDGRWLLHTRQTIKGFYGDSRQAWLIDRKDDAHRRLAADWDRSLDGMIWAPDSKSLYASIDDAGTLRVHRIDIANGRRAPVTTASSFSSLAIEGSPATLVGLRQSFSEPPTLVRINTRDGSATKLSDQNDARLAGVAFGKVESVTYQGAGGDDIQMWVAYPPGFDPGKKYPLYLLLHGGPHNGITDSWTFRWNAQVFAGWGYVVAWHNFHGSSGFGQAFTDSINPDHITKPYQDTIRAAEWFASKPWIDRDRLIAGGGSYGGFLAATLNGKPHPFKALVAHAAVYSEYAQYGADYGAGKRRFFEAWERPEEFARYSPNTYAAGFATPTLVIVGQLDQRVPLNNGIELFNTLQNRGVESRLVYFPDENHWVLKRQNSMYWYKEVRDWLEHYAPAGAR